MDYRDFKYYLAAWLMCVPFMAFANMIWPSIYIMEQYYSWYVILAGLLVEIIAAHIFLKEPWLKSAGLMLATNLVSGLCGVVCIPASGIFVELLTIPFGGGTFSISHWILDYIFAALANTCVEGAVLKWLFHYPFKANFLWLFGANAVSVLICVSIILFS